MIKSSQGESFDFILVGMGLAGSALAYHLINQGARLLVIDEPVSGSASKVAAGLYNPITGRKMVKTWKADLLFPTLIDYYHTIEDITGESFLQETGIYRPFISVEEQNEWMGKSATGDFSPFVEKVYPGSRAPFFKDKYGGIALHQSGFLNIPVYLEAIKKWVGGKCKSLKERFDHRALLVRPGHVKYKKYTGDKILFSEGVGLLQNPWLNWLPLAPNKGEILHVKSNFHISYILNRGVFVCPVGDGEYKVGSTYDHRYKSRGPTSDAKDSIARRLKDLIAADFQITDHYAGLRPATKDRRPFVGKHPETETIGVFNGLGTKGVSLAPYLAQEYALHLINSKNIEDDVNIERYFSLYFNSQKN